jgi:hypothetical protein
VLSILKKRYYLLTGIFVLLIVSAMFLPSSPYMAEVYLDIVNGRIKYAHKILGLTLSSTKKNTEFSKLVTQLGLEAKPDWELIGAQGTDYMGNFNYDAYVVKGYFWELESWLIQSPDDPTTVILEARRLLKAGGDSGLNELLPKLRRTER